MEKLISCSALSLEFLGFHGSPHVQCQIFYLFGGIGWGNIYLPFGIKFRCVWCGVFGGNTIGGHLKIWIDWMTNCLLSFLVPFLIGLGLGDSRLVNHFWYVKERGIGEHEMFISFGILMIGRQMWWMIYFNSWHPIYLQWLMVIVWDGSWQRTGILLSTRIILSYMVLLLLFIHGKVFGRLRHPNVSLSLFGQPHGR